MTKIKKMLFIIVTISFLFTLIMPTFSIADPISNPGDFKPDDPSSGDYEIVTEKAGIILSSITTIGIVTSVLVLIIIGIKYMIGSVEEKAEYKKTMIPYVVGALMLLFITTFVRIIAEVAYNVTSTI